MKIVFITGHLCKERHALLYELALDLGAHGAEVEVLTGFPSRRISNDVREYYLQHPVECVGENVIVRRVGSRRGEGKGLLMRMLKYARLTRRLYKEAKKISADAYYLYSSPPFLGYIGAKLSKLAPTLYNAQDLFPNTLIHMKGLSRKNPLIRYFLRKEKRVYQKNTRIVTISQSMKKTIVSSGCADEKVEVIYNWADTQTLHHVEKSENRLMDELGIEKDKFIVSYAGDIGLFQGWDTIINSAKILRDRNKEIQFVLIGSGSYKETLENRVQAESIENIQVFPLQPASRLSEIYSIGDIELVPIEKGITKMALPSKTGVIMATGSPVLALVDEGSDIERIINEKEIGVAIEHGDAVKLAEAIEYCYINRHKLSEWGHNARSFACENFSREKQTKKYFDVLKSICGETDE